MRVGIVCPYDWSAPGGVKQHIRDLAYALQDQGHEVSVLTPCEDESDPRSFPLRSAGGSKTRSSHATVPTTNATWQPEAHRRPSKPTPTNSDLPVRGRALHRIHHREPIVGREQPTPVRNSSGRQNRYTELGSVDRQKPQMVRGRTRLHTA